MEKLFKSIVKSIVLIVVILLAILGGSSGLLFLLKNLTEVDAIGPSIVMGGIGLVAIIIAAIFILFRLDMVAAKKVMRTYGLTKEVVEADLEAGYQNVNVVIGKRFFACTPGYIIRLGKIKDVIWVYYHTMMLTEHYGIFKTKKPNHFLVLMMRDGNSYQLTVESVVEAENLMDWLRRNHPHILLGLTEERRNLFHQNFRRLVEMSDEMGKEYEKPAAYYNEVSLEEVTEQSKPLKEATEQSKPSSSGFKLSSD